MSQIRLYVDEDAHEHAVIAGLRNHGIDVLSVADASNSGATDEQQLSFAISVRRCIYTLNVAHFCRLHTELISTGGRHRGIIVIPRQRYSIGEKIRKLTALFDSVTAEEMENRLEFL